jgi:hypothetical protein
LSTDLRLDSEKTAVEVVSRFKSNDSDTETYNQFDEFDIENGISENGEIIMAKNR